MTNTTRSRLFFGQRNYEYETHDFNEETKEKIKISNETETEWRQRVTYELFSLDYNYLALIFHDRDVKDLEHNELKGLHCHFVIRYDNPRSYDKILQDTKCQERNLSRSTNEGSILRYLTHTTPEAMRDQKTRYNVSEILVKTDPDKDFLVGNDLELWYRQKIKTHLGRKESDTKVIDFVADLAFRISSGEFKPFKAREMLINEFGNEFGQSIFRKEKKKFEEDYCDFLDFKKRDMLLNGKQLNTIYIEGPSSVGKTLFAQDLANAINYLTGHDILDTYIAAKKNKGSSTWDWISQYRDEYVTIFNDLEPTLFTFTDFLGIFETKGTLVDVSSRYKNKTWFSEYAIITKSSDIKEFVDRICSGELRENNKAEHFNIRKQVQRRFKLIIKIEPSSFTLSKFENGQLINLNQIQYQNVTEFWTGKIRQKIISDCLNNLDIK